MSKKLWRCSFCKDTRPYRSLCRNCTEYDENGKVIHAVPMVKEIQQSNNTLPKGLGRVFNEGQRGFRVKRKPTKKQIEKINSEMGSLAPHQEGQFTLLAESDDSEE